MKRAAWAAGVSVGVHLVVLASLFLLTRPKPKPQAEQVRPVVLTRVSLAARATRPSSAEGGTPRRQRHHSARGRVSVRAAPTFPDEQGGAPSDAVPGFADDALSTGTSDSGEGPSAPSASSEVDVSASVHQRLVAMAGRCYPVAARRYQQRGTVQLSFCTDVRGSAVDAHVTKSSGFALLDGAAQGCVVESAAPFPAEAVSRCFSVPIRFGTQ